MQRESLFEIEYLFVVIIGNERGVCFFLKKNFDLKDLLLLIWL